MNLEKELIALKENGWLKDLSLINISQIEECVKNSTSPKIDDIFNAFKLFSPDETKVIIIGQDPYPDDDKYRVKHYGQRAHGLAFSFGNNIEVADDSLQNIFKAIAIYRENLKITENNDIYNWNTNLKNWAKNNKVLLLNIALTFEKTNLYKEYKTKSKEQLKEIKNAQNRLLTKHKNTWKPFFNEIIKSVLMSDEEKKCIFLWGKKAQTVYDNAIKTNGIKPKQIKIYRTTHPSLIVENRENGNFTETSPSHFLDCDKFLGKNIWLNFPECE